MPEHYSHPAENCHDNGHDNENGKISAPKAKRPRQPKQQPAAAQAESCLEQPVISDDRKTGISTITNTISIVLPSTGGQRWCYGTLLAVVALGMIGMGYGIAKRNKTNKEGDAR